MMLFSICTLCAAWICLYMIDTYSWAARSPAQTMLLQNQVASAASSGSARRFRNHNLCCQVN